MQGLYLEYVEDVYKSARISHRNSIMHPVHVDERLQWKYGRESRVFARSLTGSALVLGYQIILPKVRGGGGAGKELGRAARGLDWGLVNSSARYKSSLPSVFVNKVLLEHSYTRLFTCCLRQLSYAPRVETSRGNRNKA